MSTVQPFNADARGRTRTGGALTAVAILCLYVFDAAVLGQGFVAAALLIVVALGLLPKWLLLRRVGIASWPTLRLALSLGVCAAAIMATIDANNEIAKRRGNELVQAIDHYRAIAGRFPPSLDALTPAYIEHIPRAKYTLSFNRFDYANAGGRVVLGYVTAPPFGRTVYDFAERRWREPNR